MKPLKVAWKKWKDLSVKAASFQGRIILTVFYFTFLLPFGLFFTLKKPKKHIKSMWNIKNTDEYSKLEGLKKQ